MPITPPNAKQPVNERGVWLGTNIIAAIIKAAMKCTMVGVTNVWGFVACWTTITLVPNDTATNSNPISVALAAPIIA